MKKRILPSDNHNVHIYSDRWIEIVKRYMLHLHIWFHFLTCRFLTAKQLEKVFRIFDKKCEVYQVCSLCRPPQILTSSVVGRPIVGSQADSLDPGSVSTPAMTASLWAPRYLSLYLYLYLSVMSELVTDKAGHWLIIVPLNVNDHPPWNIAPKRDNLPPQKSDYCNVPPTDFRGPMMPQKGASVGHLYKPSRTVKIRSGCQGVSWKVKICLEMAKFGFRIL